MKYSFRRSRFAGCGRIGGKARSLLIHNRSECVLVRLLAVSALVSAAFVQTPAQISSPVGFTTFQTNQLASPTAPTATAGPGCTSGATNYSWTYEVVAIDATGGVTMPSGPSTAVLNKCSTSSSLSNVAYLIVATNPVVGAVSCGIYRISPTPAKIAYNIPCGSVYYDIGTNIDTTSPPTGNTTGGMRATGTIAAQAFNATGNGAGTEILTAGTPSLMSCNLSLPPCISQASEFFFQAVPTISASWGITVPTVYPSVASAFLLGASSGTGSTFYTSTAYTLPLTDSGVASTTYVATASNASLPFTNGDLAQLSVSGGNTDIADSGIGFFSISASPLGGIFLPSIVLPLSAGSSEVLESGSSPFPVKVIQVVVPYKISVGHVTVDVSAGSSGKFSIGVYYATSGTNNKLIDTGNVNCTAGIASIALGSSVVLQPGIYYYAFAASDTTCALDGSSSSNGAWTNAVAGATRSAVTTGVYTSTTPLPSPLGSITANNSVVAPFAFLEP